MMAEPVPLLVMLIGLGWPMLERRPVVKKLLLWSGVFAIVHHLLGTFAYNAISPFNPLKSDWRFGEDFIMLYVQRFGVIEMLKGLLVSGGLFVGLLAVGGYYITRFFLPSARPSPEFTLGAASE